MPESRTNAMTRQPGDATAENHQLRRNPQPRGIFERFADEIDRVFDDFGVGHGRKTRWGVDADLWSPSVEMFHRNSELVVRADLPGLSKDDVKVDVTDDAITIQGERHREHTDERTGMYRSERSYGTFQRVIPLPEGAIADQAKASFRDGVLEITMPAPPEHVTRGRRLEITEGTTSRK